MHFSRVSLPPPITNINLSFCRFCLHKAQLLNENKSQTDVDVLNYILNRRSWFIITISKRDKDIVCHGIPKTILRWPIRVLDCEVQAKAGYLQLMTGKVSSSVSVFFWRKLLFVFVEWREPYRVFPVLNIYGRTLNARCWWWLWQMD